MEGVNEVGEVKMEEESEDKRPEHKVEDEKRKNMPHVLTSSVLLVNVLSSSSSVTTWCRFIRGKEEINQLFDDTFLLCSLLRSVSIPPSMKKKTIP